MSNKMESTNRNRQVPGTCRIFSPFNENPQTNSISNSTLKHRILSLNLPQTKTLQIPNLFVALPRYYTGVYRGSNPCHTLKGCVKQRQTVVVGGSKHDDDNQAKTEKRSIQSKARALKRISIHTTWFGNCRDCF